MVDSRSEIKMKYTLTYLEDTTIICFEDNVVTVDQNLKFWEAELLKFEPWIRFQNKCNSGIQLFVNRHGCQKWYEGAHLHRDDGPAVIFQKSGVKEWWIHGIRSNK